MRQLATRSTVAVAIFLSLASTSHFPYGRSTPKPQVLYTIKIDPADLSGFSVEMRIHVSTSVVHLAMASHPEYDDRYSRYVENLTGESSGHTLSVVREGDALWRIEGAGGEVTVTYRIHLPPVTTPLRAAWRPFLSADGGMVGDLHSFMYVLGAESSPARVTLDMPKDWAVASGLDTTNDPHRLSASSTELLLDSPIVVGHFRQWDFSVNGIPHHVIYFPTPNTAAFDAAAFVDGVRKIANEAFKIFGKAPYRSYTFIYMDGTSGALEHLNSVTLSANSANLAHGFSDTFQLTAHEFFHTWNLMHVRPSERIGLHYHRADATPVLWWSEGVTVYFGDLLLRRAKLPLNDSTRVALLERNIADYLSTPGYTRISPERASLADYDPMALGDDYASYYLQGQLLGTLLDLTIIDATDGKRSLDDAMRLLSDRFDPSHGIAEADIERTVHESCGCDAHDFFKRYVRRAEPIDFNRYLRAIGLESQVTWQAAKNADGTTAPDLRIFLFNTATDPRLRLHLIDPASPWARAGLETGDIVISVDGQPLANANDFRTWLRLLRVGQTVHLEILRSDARHEITVPLNGYDRPTVHLVEIKDETARQRCLRERWKMALRNAASKRKSCTPVRHSLSHSSEDDIGSF